MDVSLRELRIKTGLSQTRLAALIGCRQHQISQWETGVHYPTLPYMVRLAAFLNTSLTELTKAVFVK